MKVTINRFSRWLYLTLPQEHDVSGIKLYRVSGARELIQSYSASCLILMNQDKIQYEDLFIVGRQRHEFENAEVSAALAKDIEQFFELTMHFPEQQTYKTLKQRYGLQSKRLALLSPQKTNFTWSFFSFLQEFHKDATRIPSDAQIEWLDKLQENAFLGSVFDRKYLVNNDEWAPAKASSYWRKARDAQKALKSTEAAIDDKRLFSPKARAAALTSRAAALKELKQLTAAENCLRWAYKLDGPSEHLKKTWSGYDAN